MPANSRLRALGNFHLVGNSSVQSHSFSKRYLLHEQLGAGGEGVVFRATDRLTGKVVAIKHVRLNTQAELKRPSHEMNTAARKVLIAHEFQTLASLRHPNIISVLDYGFTSHAAGNLPYFTMEYLGNAKTVLEAASGQLLDKKSALLFQILHALQYLHQRGILHRDLKPANVLVERNQLKLLDFGLSSTLNKARGVSGTLPYMPPEFMQDQPLSRASDLYSFGIIAYEMLAGHHPFSTHDPSRLVFEILFHQPEFDTVTVPRPLIKILQKLLEKEPEARYQSAQEVALALSAALGQPPPPETEAIRESFLRQATFVGREREMTRLLTDFQQLAARSSPQVGRAWLIGGEGGVGKTRLLSEFRAQALVNGGIVLQGRSFAEHTSPYHVWEDVLRQLVVLTSPDFEAASVLKAVLPDIERVLMGMPFVIEAAPLEGQASQARLRAVLRRLFLQLIESEPNRPVIVILEDIHWAVSASLELLRDLHETLADLPVMFLAVYQSDEAPHLPEQFPDFEMMLVNRLEKADIASLSEAMLGVAGKDPHLIGLLTRETEGNVLFLIETIRTLAAETDRLAEIRLAELPKSVRVKGVEELLVRRLARVSGESRPLLAFAAIVGRRIDPALLTHGLPWEIDLEKWLLELSNAAVIQWIEGGHWVFAHEKLRQVIIRELSPRRRQELHRRAAEAIEMGYPDTPAYYGQLVFHWCEAVEPEQEFKYVSLVGEHMLKTSAFRETIAYYQRGLDLLAQRLVHVDRPYEKLTDFSIKKGAALAGLGDYEQANQEYHLALAMSQEHGYEKGVAQGYHGLAKNFDALGNYQEAQAFYAWALTIFEKLEDAKGSARARHGLGRVALRMSALNDAKQAFLASLEDYRLLGEKTGEGSVYCGLGDVERSGGEYASAKEYYLLGLAAFEQSGNREGVGIGYNNLGVLAEVQGNYQEAIDYHEQSLKIKQEIGSRQGIAISMSNIGVAYYSMQNFEKSREYAEKTAEIYRTLNDQQGIADSLNNIGLLDFHLEKYGQARDRLEAARQLCEKIGDQWGVALAQLNLGKVARELNADHIAVTHFREAIEIASTIKVESIILQALIEHAPILRKLGDLTQAVFHLSHATHNAKTPGFERGMAENLLKEMASEISPAPYQQAIEKGRSHELTEIVKSFRMVKA